jgi:hypothetical protein
VRKAGLLVPRLDGQSTLVWPDGYEEQTLDPGYGWLRQAVAVDEP